MNLRPPGPNYESTNLNCFVWCRLGNSVPLFFSLSCTEFVPRIVASLADKDAPFFSCLPELHPFRAYTVARPIGTRSGGLALSCTARGPLPFHDGSSVLLEPQMRIGPCGTSGGGLRLSGTSPTCRLRGGSTIWFPALCPHRRHNPSGYGRSTLHRPLKPTPR